MLAPERHDRKDKQSRESSKDTDFPESESHMTVVEIRVNHPVDVYVLHDQNNRRDQQDIAIVSFCITRKQSQERHDETEDQKRR